MPKKTQAGQFDSPGNLWGKPLGRPAPTPDDEITGTRSDDADYETDDSAEIDVDAELDAADNYDESEDIATADPDDEPAADDGDIDDDDGLAYAPEDGDEVVAENDAEPDEGDEPVVSTVDYDDVEDESAPQKSRVESKESRKRSMADKKKISLSDHVRNEIDRRKNANASLRGVDIVAALEKRGITVSAAQVSQLLKKAGLGGTPRKRKAAGAATGGDEKSRMAEKAAKREPTPPNNRQPAKKPAPEKIVVREAAKLPAKTSGFRVPMAQLQAAEQFVEACNGSFENAERILTAAAQLAQTFGR